MPNGEFPKSYYTAPNGDVYMCTATELTKRGPKGESKRALLYRSRDGGTTYSEVPLELSWHSFVAGRLFGTWPPESIDQIEVREGTVTITFHDREDSYERSPLPFRWGDESLWRACQLPNERWRLERVRHLDYDGADSHLRWEDSKISRL